MTCLHCAAGSPLIGELHKVETLDEYDAAIYFPCAKLNKDIDSRLATLEEACKAVCLECLGGTEQENRSRNCYNPNFPCNITPIRRLMEPNKDE